MNKIEKIVYDLLKGNPKIKLAVRNIYQSLFDLVPDRKNYFLNDPIVKEGHFFGFHDISPFSYDEKYVLTNKLEIPLRMPEPNDPLTVGFWNSDFSLYTIVGTSYGWNYHKGCRLQWLGKSNDKFIYNSLDGDKPCSYIYSINDKKETAIAFPIDTISPDGNFATGFSYQRLNKLMPGYGYNCVDDACLEERLPEHTGMYLIDLKNNQRKMLISLKELSQIQPDDTMINANHFVTHSEFSPDGKYISFLHRWTFDDPNKRYSRLVTCRLDGTDIHISPTSGGMVSHYVWDKKHGILAYCQVDNVDGHYIFNNETMTEVRRVAPTLNSDGHQSYIPGTDFMITDTYPDRRRYAMLYKVNLENNDVVKIVDVKSFKEFQSPSIYQHWAADLHPRVSPLGNYVCFDSVFTGQRAFCAMKLK